MLILTRQLGETILIGNNISIQIIACQNNQVRLGINAPKNIAVHREEVYRRLQQTPPR